MPLFATFPGSGRFFQHGVARPGRFQRAAGVHGKLRAFSAERVSKVQPHVSYLAHASCLTKRDVGGIAPVSASDGQRASLRVAG